MEEACRCQRRSPPPTYTTSGRQSRRWTPSSCEHHEVRGGRRICASIRATTSTTSIARFEHVEFVRTSVDEAKRRGDAGGDERGAGSWSERTPGTTGFAHCSFAGSDEVPTTWLSSIS